MDINKQQRTKRRSLRRNSIENFFRGKLHRRELPDWQLNRNYSGNLLQFKSKRLSWKSSMARFFFLFVIVQHQKCFFFLATLALSQLFYRQKNSRLKFSQFSCRNCRLFSANRQFFDCDISREMMLAITSENDSKVKSKKESYLTDFFYREKQKNEMHKIIGKNPSSILFWWMGLRRVFLMKGESL